MTFRRTFENPLHGHPRNKKGKRLFQDPNMAVHGKLSAIWQTTKSPPRYLTASIIVAVVGLLNGSVHIKAFDKMR